MSFNYARKIFSRWELLLIQTLSHQLIQYQTKALFASIFSYFKGVIKLTYEASATYIACSFLEIPYPGNALNLTQTFGWGIIT